MVAKPIIYVIDDDSTIRKVVSRLLESKGYKVITCIDGLDFKERLADEGDINLVITDLMMPLLDGIEVIKILKKNKINVVAMTACDPDEDIVKRAKSLDVHIIWKPFDNNSLIKCVETNFH